MFSVSLCLCGYVEVKIALGGFALLALAAVWPAREEIVNPDDRGEKDHAAGVVTDYAIGGATAVLFYAEPTRTYDVDVFVTLPTGANRALVSVGRDLDVHRLQVAMDDAVLVRRLERLGNLCGEREPLVHRRVLWRSATVGAATRARGQNEQEA